MKYLLSVFLLAGTLLISACDDDDPAVTQHIRFEG